MTDINNTEVWRQIPPEEKFELMARAQASGILAAIITIVIASTIAVGLRLTWVMWGSLVMSPFIFQFAAGKKWRSIRPVVMLEYLAVRSAARRYAFTANAKDLAVALIFRGRVEKLFGEDRIQEALEAAIEKTKEAEVWVTLFNDAVVMMSERVGGAKLEFACTLGDKLTVEGVAKEGKGDYSADKEIYLTYHGKEKEGDRRLKLTSRHPAALVVFEKKIKALTEQVKVQLQLEATALLATPDVAEEEEEDNMY